MKKPLLRIAFIAFVFFTGCKEDPPKVNFLLNGQDVLASNEQPAANDDTRLLRIEAGQEVVFQDATEPSKKVKSWIWDFGGDGSPDFDVDNFSVPIEEVGFYKVILYINGSELSCTKWILAEMPAPVDTAVAVVEKPKNETASAPTKKPRAPKSKPAVVLEPYAPPPSPAETKPVIPPPPIKEKDLLNLMVMGGTSSARKADVDCMDDKLTSFSVTLKPNQPVELSSFVVFTDGCGGIRLSLTGGDLDERATVSLVRGRNLLSLASLDDTRLSPGVTYTLSGTAVAKYGACQDERIPHFEEYSDCSIPVKPSNLLDLNQRGNLLLFDLKFKY